MADLRELAKRKVADLEEIAADFPEASPGRKAIRRAAYLVRLYYVFGTFQKKRVVETALSLGSITLSDLAAATGIGRRELVDLLAELTEAGIVTETRESMRGFGRPSRCFRLVEPDF